MSEINVASVRSYEPTRARKKERLWREISPEQALLSKPTDLARL